MTDVNATNDIADRLLNKVRAFTAQLETDERELFAALVGPGVALAHREADDVEGFATTWEPRRLPEHLASVLREQGVRVIGL